MQKLTSSCSESIKNRSLGSNTEHKVSKAINVNVFSDKNVSLGVDQIHDSKCNGELTPGNDKNPGEPIVYITKCFYNSNYDKSVLKSLIAKDRPKVAPPKVTVKS